MDLSSLVGCCRARSRDYDEGRYFEIWREQLDAARAQHAMHFAIVVLGAQSRAHARSAAEPA